MLLMAIIAVCCENVIKHSYTVREAQCVFHVNADNIYAGFGGET
jgi:hypothetical protein